MVWFRTAENPDSFLYKLMMMTDNNNQFVNKWTNDVKCLLQDLGFSYLFDNPHSIFLKSIIQRIYDQYYQQWFSEINNSSKLDTYSLIKSTFGKEKYLDCIINNKYRIALSRFRCSAHKLMIEEGRFRNIERNQRFCLKCNMNVVETEYHFLLACPYYIDLRREYLPKYYCSWPNVHKFKMLMNNSQQNVIKKLSQFIYYATLARETTGS